MKLVVERSALMKTLAHAYSVVERRSTIPVLSNIRLEAEDRSLKVTATDMDLEVVQHLPAEVSVPGTTTAPAHLFHDICRKLPDGSEVALDRKEETGRLLVLCGSIEFEFAILPPEDFPLMTATPYSHSFSLPAADMRRLLDRSRFAALVEGARMHLQGIFFHATTGEKGEVLRAVATDGHRLARVDSDQPAGADGMPEIIVPNKTISVLRGLIDEADEDISVDVADRKVSFRFGAITMTSKLLDGTFPNYQMVIPDNNDRILEAPTNIFVNAADRMSVISRDKGRPIKLAIESDHVVLSASNLEGVTGEEKLAVSYEGPPMVIGFNSRYISEMAQHFDGDVLHILMAEESSPAIIRDAGDDRTLYVLMPLRV